ncbi:hypothetical protein HanRHA438_Chr15g0700961 [Helianthus annuus]|nr:hypothetical protein HanRHA438_Chr15g0700961 [Helianthus annuus]
MCCFILLGSHARSMHDDATRVRLVISKLVNKEYGPARDLDEGLRGFLGPYPFKIESVPILPNNLLVFRLLFNHKNPNVTNYFLYCR